MGPFDRGDGDHVLHEGLPCTKLEVQYLLCEPIDFGRNSSCPRVDLLLMSRGGLEDRNAVPPPAPALRSWYSVVLEKRAKLLLITSCVGMPRPKWCLYGNVTYCPVYPSLQRDGISGQGKEDGAAFCCLPTVPLGNRRKWTRAQLLILLKPPRFKRSTAPLSLVCGPLCEMSSPIPAVWI